MSAELACFGQRFATGRTSQVPQSAVEILPRRRGRSSCRLAKPWTPFVLLLGCPAHWLCDQTP